MAPPRSAYPRPADEDDPQVIRCLGRTSLGCCFLRDLKLNAYSLRRVWRNRYLFLSYSFVFVCVIRVFVCLFVVIIANVYVIVFILGDVIVAIILYVLLNFRVHVRLAIFKILKLPIRQFSFPFPHELLYPDVSPKHSRIFA